MYRPAVVYPLDADAGVILTLHIPQKWSDEPPMVRISDTVKQTSFVITTEKDITALRDKLNDCIVKMRLAKDENHG